MLRGDLSGEAIQGRATHAYLEPIHLAGQQKLTHYKAAILQIKKKERKEAD